MVHNKLHKSVRLTDNDTWIMNSTVAVIHDTVNSPISMGHMFNKFDKNIL